MQDDHITRILKDDFDADARRLEKDRFADRVLSSLGARRRRRHGAIIAAGGAGALIAASQFRNAVQSIAPPVADQAHGDAYQILMMLMIGGVMAASAFVLRQEN